MNCGRHRQVAALSRWPPQQVLPVPLSSSRLPCLRDHTVSTSKKNSIKFQVNTATTKTTISQKVKKTNQAENGEYKNKAPRTEVELNLSEVELNLSEVELNLSEME